MYTHQRAFGGGGGFGLSGPVPRDVWLLLGTVFVTFALRFFDGTAGLAALLRLGPEVWRRGFFWQVVTYPFAGTGTASFWFVIELLVLFLFARQILYQLGRRRFWRLLLGTSAGAACVALLVHIVVSLFGAGGSSDFVLMQGQRMLLAILVAAFASLNRNATILLFFVLPVQAKWFLLLEIVFAFLGFLNTHDFVGFVGVVVAVGTTVAFLRPGSPLRGVRDLKLRLETLWLRARLAWLRRRRGFTVVSGEKGNRRDPWVH
jgi:hypothetical protein